MDRACKCCTAEILLWSFFRTSLFASICKLGVYSRGECLLREGPGMFSRLAVAAQPLQWLPGAVPRDSQLDISDYFCKALRQVFMYPSVMPQGAPGPHSEPSQPTQSPATLPHWGRRLELYAAADWQCFSISTPTISRFCSAERSPLAVLKPEVLELQSGANHGVVSLQHC